MKRLSVVIGLFHLVTWMSFASVLTQHSAFGQSSGFGGPSGLAGGEGGFGEGAGGFSIPSPLTGRGGKGSCGDSRSLPDVVHQVQSQRS